jgi:TPR repeat protein
MKPRTPGFWLIVATFGLLALLPMQALAGMTPEEVRQFKSYKARAEQGDANAQGWVGFYYNNGFGVAKNYVQAHKWYNLSAASGEEIAKKTETVYLCGCKHSANGIFCDGSHNKL